MFFLASVGGEFASVPNVGSDKKSEPNNGEGKHLDRMAKASNATFASEMQEKQPADSLKLLELNAENRDTFYRESGSVQEGKRF